MVSDTSSSRATVSDTSFSRATCSLANFHRSFSLMSRILAKNQNSMQFILILTDEFASLMAEGRLSGKMLFDDVAGR